MKTFRPYILVLAVSFVASPGLMSCLHGGTINSIKVTPANVSMANGTTQQFIAIATFTDGTTLNWTSAVNWSSSNTGVATVGSTVGSNGFVTSIAPGTAIITATDLTNNLSGTATVTVTNAVFITVTPANQTIAANGTTQQFTATETFTDGTTLDLTTLVFWSSSDTGVATISNASGTNGLAITVAAGTTSITATDLITNITGTTTLTVINP